MAMIESWFKQDLNSPVQVKTVKGEVFTQDSQANLIGVEVFDNGSAATLTGTVSGYVIRQDGGTIAIEEGTLEGNKCSIVLPATAYAVPGSINIAIKLTDDEVVTTLLDVTGTVYRTSTDAVVYPGELIPSVEALIEELEQTVTSMQAAADDIEEQKDTMIASIAAIAEMGTDTTLTQSGVAADAKATGSAIDGKQDVLTFDNSPTQNSSNPVKSGGVYNALQSISQDAVVENSTATGIDLDVSDEQGNVLVRMKDGHIQTKNFDSSDVEERLSEAEEDISDLETAIDGKQDVLTFDDSPTQNSSNPVKSSGVYNALQSISQDAVVENSTATGIDLDVSDEQGNVILRLSDGYIKTKNFDSKTLATKMIYPSGFVSRLKPNVYRIGSKYFTDFDITAHKLIGTRVVWVDATASSGGSGTEDNPYNNVNTAISSGAKTIYLKTGTYVLGTHFNDQTDIVGKNVIGIGNVIIDCTSATNGPWRCKNGSAYLENVEIQGGVYAFYAQMTDTDTLYMYKVKLHDTSNNALYVLGGNVYAVECVAYNAAYDGFNYHANDSYIPNVVEIDCVAYDCGDGTRDSDNGSTIHDGASIVRIGGEYYRCHGGVVADKGYDSTKPCYSVNYGVYAHDSTHAIANNDSFKASFWAQTYTKMWLFDCKTTGSMYEISSTDHAEVFSACLMSENMFSPSDYTATSGTIIRIGGV